MKTIFSTFNIYKKITIIVLSCILPALFLFFSYKRFFIDKLPKALQLNFIWYNVLLMVCSFGLLCYAIIKTAKKLNIIKPAEKVHPYIMYIKNMLQKIIFSCYQLLVTFYELCWNFLEILTFQEFLRYHIVIKFAKITTYKQCKNIFILFLLGLNFVPRILFTVASVYDIFWMHYFEKIYVIIPYLLLPFLAKIILFILRHNFIAHIEDYMDAVVQDEDPSNSSYLYLHPAVIRLPYNIKDFDDFFENHLKVLVNVGKFLKFYYALEKHKSFLWLTFIMLLVRLICFFTVLFISLHIITPW